MLATQEAQVIPTTQMKHFWTLTSGELARWLAEFAWGPLPLLAAALLGDCRSGRWEDPELTGLDSSRLWVLFTGSEEKEEQKPKDAQTDA